jgi:hypothetical protein
MKIAILFTGALRTVKKTIKYFKKHLLLHNDVNVFACVQNDTSQSEDEWTKWFNEQIGFHLKEISWFSIDKYPHWVTHRDLLLDHIHLDGSWKGYLRNSGSMIEYFQLQLAYMKMCRYENQNHMKYDYIIRSRTDSIYAKPVDFHWLSWTDEEVAKRVEVIQNEMKLCEIENTPQQFLKYFMCTIISDDLIPNLQFILADYTPSQVEILPKQSDTISFESSLNEYIKKGRYILTLRKNNLYIVRRDLFHLIPTLGTMYGFMKSPISDNYWFNAECQFRDACYYSCLSIFEYSTVFEEKSLEYPHYWNEANFFDLDFNPINPRMLYCVVRK